MSAMCECAINLYEEHLRGMDRGWRYTPLNGKCPTRAGWPIRPMTSTDLEEWVLNGSNIGLITGAMSGIYAVDLDDTNTIPPEYPVTVTVRTGSGYHLYYQHVPGLRNTRNLLGEGVDTRGDGGQVVAVGSLHKNGTVYHWVEGRSPDEIAVAEMAPWMLERLL